MNQIVANFIEGIFNGINSRTAYKLGIWINGLVAAILGALVSSAVQLLGQVAFTTGPIKWAKVIEWAEAGAIPAVLGYYAKSPIKTVFEDSTVTVTSESRSTPTTQTESTTTTITPNAPKD